RSCSAHARVARQGRQRASRKDGAQLVRDGGQWRRAVGTVQARQRLLRGGRRAARCRAGPAVVQPRRAAGPAAGPACARHHAAGRGGGREGSGRRLQVAGAGGARRKSRLQGRAREIGRADQRGRPPPRRGAGPDLRADVGTVHRGRPTPGVDAPAFDPIISRAMSLPSDARPARPDITLAVCRGACRLMRQAGYSVLLEVPLPDGRRADILAVSRSGELTIVEVKSSLEDWRVDAKWPDYLGWCDQLFFAVPADFPQVLIPAEIGLIVADAYGGEMLRAA